MKIIPRNVFQYYYIRLSLFWPDSKIAEEMGVSIMTLRRWKTILPPVREQAKLDRAIRQLLKSLRRQSLSVETKVYGRVADALEIDSPPEFVDVDRYRTRSASLVQGLDDFLRGKTLRSTTIMRKFQTDLGYTRMQINYAAKKLGVKKVQVQPGPNGYSEWSLK